MLRNYLTVAFRNLQRHPGYTAINLTGLAAGMMACLLIGLYIEDELSFDRFHEKADRIHVVTGRSLTTPYSLATALESAPDVEQTTRVWRGRITGVTREGERLQVDLQALLTEPSFFDMFSFPASVGKPSAALRAPDAVVISESTARRFFGAEYSIGKSLEFERSGPGENVRSVVIGAVVNDAPPNSSIQFDVIAPLASLGPNALRENQWGFDLFETYVETKSPVPANALTDRINAAIGKQLGPDTDLTFSALPLTAFHLSGLTADGLEGRPMVLYLFGTIALFVLLIAAVNYVNLVTAQASRRTREVGVRKAMGARRLELIGQFLCEATLLSMAAMGIALWSAYLALPAFGRLFGKELIFWGAEYGFALPVLGGIVLLLVILASVYPAYVISRFQPTEALRGGGSKATLTRTFGLRGTLVVLQFTVSVGLIIGTAVMYHQIEYVQNKDLGFDRERVVVVDLGARMPLSVRESFKQRIVSHPSVLSASVPNAVPSRFMMGYTRAVDEAAPQSRVDAESMQFRPAVVDYDFLPTLQIPVLAGRNFSRDFPTDVSRAYILNEAAAGRLGWSPEEAIGQPFALGPPETPEGEIIGVVDDFHIASLHREIEPVVLQLHTRSPVGSIPFVLVAKLAPEQIRVAVEHIRQAFNQIAPPGAPFRHTFLDDRFEAMYQSEAQMSRIFTSFASLAILLACLGLFGLAAFTAQQRTREIGVRKTLGASVASLVALLSGDFIKLVGVAFVVAAPLAYWGMQRWLEDFAYRIELGPWVFLGAGALAIGIALLTVSYQAIKAALADPAKALRTE